MISSFKRLQLTCLVILSLFVGDLWSKTSLYLGDDAPEFRLEDQEGFIHSLVQHRGQFVLLFFYPRDFIHASVKAINAFEKAYPLLKQNNVVVYGVSLDFQKTHLQFHEKFQLTYDLLSDPEEEVIEKYQAKNILGSRFISYLIGPDGRIFRKYEDESPLLHPYLVLNDLPSR